VIVRNIFCNLAQNRIELKIAVTGATGLIGTALGEYYRGSEYEWVPVTRHMISLPPDVLATEMKGCDAVINLAGAPIISRWTPAAKNRIYNSRVLTTQRLVEAMKCMQSPPGVFISGSAIGIYSNEGRHAESSKDLGEGFLTRVCLDWESAVQGAPSRVVIIRTGVVLSLAGGALKKLYLPFRLGLGGPVASGRQSFSWIHIKDMVRAIDFFVKNTDSSGAYNLTAPHPVNNLTFVKTFARIMKRSARLPLPDAIIRLVYGEGASVLTEGQWAEPERLLKEGFSFSFSTLEEALSDLLR